MEIKTSAGRLLNIIKEGKAIAPSSKCIDAWAKILNTPKSNQPLLFKRLGSVMSLPSQVQEIVVNTNGISDTKPYLKWLQPINNAFTNQNISSNWDSFSKHIDQHTIDYLSMTADMLNLQSPEVTLADSKLHELKTNFINIEKEITEADIDIDLKEFMIIRIKDILNAIDEYTFNGLEPLMDTLNITIGQIVLNNDLALKSKDSNLAKKFWNLIVNTSVIVTLATGVPQIANNLENILPLIENNNTQKQAPIKNKDGKDDIIDVHAISNEDEDT